MLVLQNANIKGDYSECDVTLLYCLLRNLPATNLALRPTAGWGKLPVAAGSTTLGDEIERIREIRNEVYAHVATTTISAASYTHYMTELQFICQRMDTIHATNVQSATPRTQTYVQTLCDIQVLCMDPDTEAKYTDDVRRMCEADRETRSLIDEVKGGLAGNLLCFLVHLSRRLKCTIVIMRCPSSVVRPSSVRRPSVRPSSLTFHIFDFFYETAKRNTTKLDGKQDFNILYKVCVFWTDWKNKMAALPSDWLRHFRLLL